MKKLIINMETRGDRRQHFTKKHKWLAEEHNFLKAVNGRQIDHWEMQEKGFAINHKWRDPFKNRRMTKGEVGCFLSHYAAWKEVVAINEPVLIMEDDCILDADKYNEDRYNQIFADTNVDILFLGYNENTPDRIQDSIEDDCHVVAYPYNTHAYIITPQAAIELVESGYHRKMIPVDEVISSFVDRLNIWSLKDQCASQVHRDVLGSDVEPKNDLDWFIDFNIHPITVGTDSSKCVKLNDSARRVSMDVKNLGTNVDWKGTDMSGPGGGQKINLIRAHLDTLPENDVVLFVDAYDVFFQFDLNTITRRYLDMETEVIFGAERVCWPDDSMASKHPTPHTNYKYLNSGTFIGRVGTLKEIFAEELKDGDDDQLYIQRVWLNDTTKYSLSLDYEGYIFQTNEPNMTISEGLLYNDETYCYPCVYHGNGGPEAKAAFNGFYNTLYGTPIEKPFYNAHFGKIDHLEKDMLVIDFMDPSQCERLIEIADKHNGWAPLAGDKFPAYEIRIKELGQIYWNELEKHWAENVYPIIEKYWQPIQMYGMRDAFAMRYSVDTQKSLPLHHDASLVTGSVKLNDNYKGASLLFPRQGINNDDVPVGKMILFPGQVTHGHQCTELEEGVKYSYTMWSSRYPGDVN
jgi:GR25 family glycosyltransferase involved in LPS biosynthesis